MLALPVLAVGLLRAEPARRRRVSALLLAAAIGYLGWLAAFHPALRRDAGGFCRRYHRRRGAGFLPVAVAARQLVLLGGAGAGGGAAGGAALADAGGGLGAHSVRPPRVRHRGHHVAAGQSGAVGQRAGGGAAPVPGCAGLPGRRHHWADVRRRGWRLHDEAMRIIRTHEGPVFAIVPGSAALQLVPPEAGLAFDAAQCRPVRANISPGAEIDLCPAQRRGTAAVLAGFRRGGAHDIRACDVWCGRRPLHRRSVMQAAIPAAAGPLWPGSSHVSADLCRGVCGRPACVRHRRSCRRAGGSRRSGAVRSVAVLQPRHVRFQQGGRGLRHRSDRRASGHTPRRRW